MQEGYKNATVVLGKECNKVEGERNETQGEDKYINEEGRREGKKTFDARKIK